MVAAYIWQEPLLSHNAGIVCVVSMGFDTFL